MIFLCPPAPPANLVRALFVEELILSHQLHSSNASPRNINSRHDCSTYIYDPYLDVVFRTERHMFFLSCGKGEGNRSSDLRRSKLLLNGDGSYRNIVAVRGCFDHLHSGHRALLETALCIASKQLIVQIIDDPKKECMEEYQPYHVRKNAIKEFLKETLAKNGIPVKVLLRSSIYPLDDVHVDVYAFGSEYYDKDLSFVGDSKLFFVFMDDSYPHATDIRKAIVQAKNRVCKQYGVYGYK